MGMAGGQETGRCGADAAHGLGGWDHLLRCKDSFPDGEAAGLCLERPGQCRESGRIVSRNGNIGSRGLIADGVQGRLQAGKLCRRTLGGRHQHDVTGVGILALHTPFPQSLCQLLTGKTQRGGVQRQLEGFAVRPVRGSASPGRRASSSRQSIPSRQRQMSSFFREAVGQNRVGGVQRLQNEIRGAGGAEESQRIAHRGLIGLHGRAKVQDRHRREDGQGLVSRVTAEVRAQLDGVAAALLQKVKIGAVGVVHQKGQAVGVADRPDSPAMSCTKPR